MTRALVVVGLVVLGTLEVPPESQHPQTQDRLGGHVYTQDSKAPVRSAIVYVISVDTGRAVTVMTSIDGSWGVAGLAPGRYRVNVRAPGYVPGTFGQTTAWGTGRTLAVPKDDVAPADVFLFKGGVISGRVVDQAGNPVVGIGVSVMRRNRSALGTTVEPIMETVKTDDLGVYRVFGVMPGHYYVVAKPVFGLFASGGASGYLPTYCPSEPASTSAILLSISAGTETFCDVSVRTGPLFRVSGGIATGPAFQGGIATLVPTHQLEMLGTPMSSLVTMGGRFAFLGVAPGEYVVQFRASQRAESVSADVPLLATVSVSNDVDGVMLSPQPRIRVRGRLVRIGSSVPISNAEGSLSIAAVANAMEPAPGPLQEGTVHVDGQFEFETWPGRRLLRLSGPAARPLVIRSVLQGGQDVTDTGVDFREDRGDISIEVVVTDQPPVLSGNVSDENGPTSDFTVIAFPKDTALRNVFRRMAAGRPNSDGRFLVRTLPPGSYLVVAVRHVESTDWMDPEYLQSLARKAQDVTLRDGQTVALHLTIGS